MNPRPRTRTARIYRFVLSFVLSESGAREGTLPRLVFRFVVLPAPRPAREVSSGQFQTFPDAQSGRSGASVVQRCLRGESKVAVVVGN